MIEYEICPMTTKVEMDEKGYVHWKAWHETYLTLMPKEYLETVTLEKCITMAHTWSQNTLLLKVNNKTVGFSCIKHTDSENELVAIYLLKQYHGQRLGYALMTNTLSLLSHQKKIILWVLKGNEKAISFYKKCGFVFNGNEKKLPFGVELQMELYK